ncbi:MAG TPA: twin-arginine translocase TatA/TatE family subunit [Candidatus Binatia bacterium]|nr:twin-arginine translocase TatA/TatE family subunit [Candidatus Binatia bacterium]
MLEGLIQPMHLLLVLAVVLIVFGPGQLPELGKGLGTAIRDFRRALHDGSRPDGATAAGPGEPGRTAGQVEHDAGGGAKS